MGEWDPDPILNTFVRSWEGELLARDEGPTAAGMNAGFTSWAGPSVSDSGAVARVNPPRRI